MEILKQHAKEGTETGESQWLEVAEAGKTLADSLRSGQSTSPTLRPMSAPEPHMNPLQRSSAPWLANAARLVLVGTCSEG